MINDILVVIWKELKEYLLQRGGIRGGWGSIAILLGVLGIFVPLQAGEAWFEVPILPLVWTWMPVFFSLSIVTDSIAGERERHTLETLLSSRLPDTAILLGKMGAAVIYSFGISMIGLLLGAVTSNIAHPEAGIRFYALNTTITLLGVGLLAPLLLAGLGVLVSLKAETARQAYQRISIVMLILWVLPNIAITVIPESMRDKISIHLSEIQIWNIVFGTLAALLVIDAILVAACIARFKRTRLAMIL